ncbi:MAG: hypothetical protein LBR76_08875 [Oscillospiraceae bacterium]|jgi:UDP-GlcNAc:undecaprenyl-phosphate GlcNAc-1-phosphate transferase|nr:hypothetical protein [Oscillospiraceae bacterium]
MPGNALFITDPGAFYNALFTLAAALIVSFAVTPLVRLLAHKVGALDDPNRDDRRIHTSPVPRLGGLAIFTGFLIAFFVFGQGQLNWQMGGILIGAVIMVVVGAVDDVLTLPWWAKLAGQLTAALIPVLCGLRVGVLTAPFITADGTISLGIFNVPITILWIIGITNAVNLIDGLDGLAVGVSGIASLSMLLIAVATGNPAAALLTAAVTGGCLGFLPYNFNPARLFMGDSGALFLGYILSCASILGLFKFYAVVSFAVPFLILGLPIFDTAAAFVRRLSKGQNPLSHGDRKHVHHRLIDMGFSQKQAVAILYSVSAILGLSAVVLTTSGELRVLILLLTVLAAGAIYIATVRKNGKKRPAETPDEGQRTGNGSSEEKILTEAHNMDIVKVSKQRLPALRFIGKKYGANENFGAKWGDWHQNGWFDLLEQNGASSENNDSYIGAKRIQNGVLEYWIGMFFPEGAPVPESFESVDIPASAAAVCWVYGGSAAEVSGLEAHSLCLAEIAKRGYARKEDDWCFEMYNCPRFTDPDEKGNIILDYAITLER